MNYRLPRRAAAAGAGAEEDRPQRDQRRRSVLGCARRCRSTPTIRRWKPGELAQRGRATDAEWPRRCAGRFAAWRAPTDRCSRTIVPRSALLALRLHPDARASPMRRLEVPPEQLLLTASTAPRRST